MTLRQNERCFTSEPMNSDSETWDVPLCFGAAPIGNLFSAISDAQARAALERAWLLGLCRIDTAPFYGHGLSEQRIGDFHRACSTRRFAVSTKVGRRLEPGPPRAPTGFVDTPPCHPVFDYSRNGILRAFEASLLRLGVDRVDTLLLHDIGSVVHGQDAHPAILAQALDEALPAMHELKAQGLAGRIGLGVNEWQVCAEVLARTDLDVVLLAGRYTLLDQSGADFLGAAADRGVAIMAAGIFNSGLLAGSTTFNYAPAPPALVERCNAIAAVCARHGVALPAAAMHFAAMHPAVSELVLGFRTAEQVADAVRWHREPPPSTLWDDLRAERLIP